MVEALAATRTDDTLHIGSLPWRTRRRQNFLDPHGLHVLPKFTAEDAVAVSQQVPRDLFKRKCLAKLLPRPLRGGMRGHVEMHDPSSVVSQNQKYVQDLKSDRRHGKEIDRHHGVDVILKEGPPSLRRWLPLAHDVFAHPGLADTDANFNQFPLHACPTPKPLFTAHFPNHF